MERMKLRHANDNGETVAKSNHDLIKGTELGAIVAVMASSSPAVPEPAFSYHCGYHLFGP